MEILRRLPEGVDYALVKLILAKVPGSLTTALWTSRDHDSLLKCFEAKTYVALDRELRRQERADTALPSGAKAERRLLLQALRYEWVREVMGEIDGLARNGAALSVSRRLVDPERRGWPQDATGVDGPAMIIDVWKAGDPAPTLVVRHLLRAGPPPWGDPRIAWYDPAKVNQLLSQVIRRHFRPALRRRVGQGWRTRREPAGWPVVTRYAIPRLYDYLRPFYRVRAYQDQPDNPRSGRYPIALRRDITHILRAELPHLAGDIAVPRVTAAIQSYLDKAPPDRPMGPDMFGVRIPEDRGGPTGTKKLPRS